MEENLTGDGSLSENMTENRPLSEKRSHVRFGGHGFKVVRGQIFHLQVCKTSFRQHKVGVFSYVHDSGGDAFCEGIAAFPGGSGVTVGTVA